MKLLNKNTKQKELERIRTDKSEEDIKIFHQTTQKKMINP